jgi:hypothetical protein
VPLKTLSLKPKPVDPQKIALSIKMGIRYVDRKGRYIAQAFVHFGDDIGHTWVDIPLVPETYGEAQS